MEPKPRGEGFWMQDILKANCELVRCLIILLMGKGLAAHEEIMLMASFAKERLENDPDTEMGRRASAYIDLMLRSLEPTASSGPVQ